MKRILIIMAVAMLSFSGAKAQNIGDLISKLTGGTPGNTVSTLTNMITSQLVPNSMEILGTWKYQKPAVMFTSDNALSSTAGTLAASKIEDKMQGYLTKVGIKNGKMSITFNSDKTFEVQRNGKKVSSGTYTLDKNDVTLTFKNKKQPCKVTPQLDNGTLVIVMDASKLQTFMVNIGSSVSSLSTVTALLKNYKGMKIGIRMSK